MGSQMSCMKELRHQSQHIYSSLMSWKQQLGPYSNLSGPATCAISAGEMKARSHLVILLDGRHANIVLSGRLPVIW
jgi:hypothetical protein